MHSGSRVIIVQLAYFSELKERSPVHSDIVPRSVEETRRAGRDVTLQLVMALVIPRLDYCNSVLAALPSSTLQLLQRVQNTAARLVFELRHHDHITPALIQLLWLPIRWRIHYKLCTLMHAVHTGRCPPYLADIVSLTSHRQSRSGL